MRGTPVFRGLCIVPRPEPRLQRDDGRARGVVESTTKSIFFPMMLSGRESPLVITRFSRTSGRYSSSPSMLSCSVGARTTSCASLAFAGAMLTVSSIPTPRLFLV